METTKTHKVYTIFQQEDGMYPINGKLLTEDELEKLIAINGDASRWIIIKNPTLNLLDGITDEKFRERVLKYLEDETDPDDLQTGQVHITGAWVLNNLHKQNLHRVFASPGALDLSKISSLVLQKICVGAELSESDRQEIISAANEI